MSNARWMWVEIACTVVIPTGILMFGTDALGATGALVVALLFPFGFAIASMVREGRPSALSMLSLVSVTLSGGVGLLALDPRWFAVKEAAVPALLGLAMMASSGTRFAVVSVILDRILDPERTRAALERTGGGPAFARVTRRATIEMGLVMVGSGVASFLLARWLVVSPAGSDAFAAELGRYTFVSFPAVTVPVLLGSAWVLHRALQGLEAAAGRLEDLLRADQVL